MEIDLISPDKDALLAKWSKELEIVLKINKFDTPLELAWLAEAASNATNIIEFGSYSGTSTKMMALANPFCRIVCLDDWCDEGIFDQFSANLELKINDGELETIRGNTSDGFKKLPDVFYAHFAFIDASHLYDDVKNDIANAISVLVPGSIISGHDYRVNLPEDGVNRAVHEAFPSGVFFPADSIWAYQMPPA